MSKKKETGYRKLVIIAGKATPAPPIGPELSHLGLNVGIVCKELNDKTKHLNGEKVRVLVRAFSDKSYEIIVGLSPTSSIIKKSLGIEKGSQSAGRNIITSVKRSTVKEIAETKLCEMTAASVEAAERTIMGSLKSMGISIEGGSDES